MVDSHWTDSGHMSLLNALVARELGSVMGDVLLHRGCRVNLAGISWLPEGEGRFPKGKPGPLPEE